jgi:hypothetical protein
MAFVEIALGHANPDWELNGGSKPISFDPSLWGGITALVDNMIRRVWDCYNLRSESTQNIKGEEMHDAEKLGDATTDATTDAKKACLLETSKIYTSF